MSLQPAAPSPVPAFSKGLVHWAEDTFVDPFTEFYDWISATVTKEDTEWRRAVFVFTRATPTGTVEDTAQVTLNITNITGGDLDTTWTTTDYTDCEAAFLEFWTALNTITHVSHTLKEVRWYIAKFNSALPIGLSATSIDPATGKPYARFENTGPPARVHPMNLPGGSAATPIPFQSAMSVTWKTAVPKHWGRIYLPGLQGGVMDTAVAGAGRFVSTAVAATSNFAAELVDDLAQKQFQLVVPTTQVDGKFHVALQTVVSVQVDDIPDVIRRRRPKQAKQRAIGVPLP